MYRQKRKHLCGIENAADRYQIVIRVLEADIARTVINRLDAAEIE